MATAKLVRGLHIPSPNMSSDEEDAGRLCILKAWRREREKRDRKVEGDLLVALELRHWQPLSMWSNNEVHIRATLELALYCHFFILESRPSHPPEDLPMTNQFWS
jgi:hypothetical protein